MKNGDHWDQIYINRNRRTAKIRTLQYGETSGRGHPFETYSSHRLLESSLLPHQSELEESEVVPPPRRSGWQVWSVPENTNIGGDGAMMGGVHFEDDRHPQEASSTSAPATLSDPPTVMRRPTSSDASSATTLHPTTTTTSSPTPGPTTHPPTVIGYDPSLYEPLRIEMDSRNLQVRARSDPQRYSQLVDYIVSVAAPRAAEFWSDHLSTIPVEGSIVVTERDCPVVWSDDDDSAYHSFEDADLVLYLLVDEGPCLKDDAPIAFSNDCLVDQFDRPIAGTLLICADKFGSMSSDTEEGRSQQQKLDEVLQHETAHVLGMSGATMPYWRDRTNFGKPYTPRPLIEEEVVCINGETESIVVPAQNTVREGKTKTGVRYFEVVTPTVRNVIANQFDCESATGARLDNNEYYNCIGSHWSSRDFGTETLVSRDMPWEQSISAVTMALFEDTGWYKANFAASSGVLKPSAHGYGAGCDFLESDCIIGNDVPDFGVNTFCNTRTEESAIRCDVSHRRASKCDLVDYNSYDGNPLYPYSTTHDPPSVEYRKRFSNPGWGSFLRFDADYCPTYSAPPSFTYDGNGKATGPLYMKCLVSETAPEDAYGFESFGNDDSTCFNTIGDIDRPLCLSIQCIESGDDITVVVSVGNRGKVNCEADGQLIDVPGFNDVKIECPRREILCPEMFCPANCSGRGICRHGVLNGCQCFDPNDASPLCENSPVVSPSIMPTPSMADEQLSVPGVGTPSSESPLVDVLDDTLQDVEDIVDDIPSTPPPRSSSPSSSSPSTNAPTEEAVDSHSPATPPQTTSAFAATMPPSQSTLDEELPVATEEREPVDVSFAHTMYAGQSNWLLLLAPSFLVIL